MGKNSLRPPGKDERAVGFAGQGADGRNGDGAFIALGGKVGDIEDTLRNHLRNVLLANHRGERVNRRRCNIGIANQRLLHEVRSHLKGILGRKAQEPPYLLDTYRLRDRDGDATMILNLLTEHHALRPRLGGEVAHAALEHHLPCAGLLRNAGPRPYQIHLSDVAASEQPLFGNTLQLRFHKQKLKVGFCRFCHLASLLSSVPHAFHPQA